MQTSSIIREGPPLNLCHTSPESDECIHDSIHCQNVIKKCNTGGGWWAAACWVWFSIQVCGIHFAQLFHFCCNQSTQNAVCAVTIHTCHISGRCWHVTWKRVESALSLPSIIGTHQHQTVSYNGGWISKNSRSRL
jgi:hypothetical protein